MKKEFEEEFRTITEEILKAIRGFEIPQKDGDFIKLKNEKRI